MDGRGESTATSGPNYSPFYVQQQHRPMGTPPGIGSPPGLHGSPMPPGGGFRHQLDAVSAGYAFQQPHFGAGPLVGQGQGYHQNHVEASPPHMAHQQHPQQQQQQHNVGGGGAGAEGGIADGKGDNQGSEGGGPQDELVKKKRGRPRKYKLDGSATALGLSSPSPSTPHSSSPGSGFGPGTMVATPGSGFGPGGSGSGSGVLLTEKRARGRPPGSGKMQQLASLGKWFLGSVGTGFTPHVIIIQAGEDVAARIMSFAQQGPRAICIISATGAVSTATLQQDSDSGAVTYEGRFEILCLSGSYLLLEEGGTRTRSGGLCIALCGPDHRVIGGSVGGILTAAGTVQVIVGSFMYGGASKKSKAKAEQVVENEDQNGGGGGEDTPTMVQPDHSMPLHPMSGWPPGMMNQMDSESPMYGDPNKNQAKAEQDMEDEERNGGGSEEPLAMAPPEHNMNMQPHHPMGGWAPAGLMRQMDSRSSNIDINSIRE